MTNTLHPIKYHTFVVLCFVVLISAFSGSMSSIYPYPSRSLHRHWGNRTIAPVPVKWPWRIWVKLTGTRSQQSANNVHISWDILYTALFTNKLTLSSNLENVDISMRQTPSRQAQYSDFTLSNHSGLPNVPWPWGESIPRNSSEMIKYKIWNDVFYELR